MNATKEIKTNESYEKFRKQLLENNCRPLAWHEPKKVPGLVNHYKAFETWQNEQGRLFILQIWNDASGFDVYLQSTKHRMDESLEEVLAHA